ncbi:MAG: porin family protein [Parabacteroides sp.]|nr:porin family protein [Parabacteroides sp.]
MKKAVLFLLLFVFAQNISSQWSIGGRIGANWSKMTDMGLSESRQKLGWNIAAVGNYSFNDWFEMQGEILYSQRGANDNWSVGMNGNAAEADLRSHYIDIPVLVQFYPFKKKECFSIQAGIQPGFFLKESVKYKDVTLANFYGDKNAVDFGLVFGGAYKFKNGLFFDGRYVLGLTDNYKDYDGVMKGRSIQLSIGYLFRLK